MTRLQPSSIIKRVSWKVWFAASLLMLSLGLYLAHYLIFQEGRFLLRMFLASLAFVPISVLLITFVVSELIRGHEKAARMQKMDMLISVFFSEMGIQLLRLLTRFETFPEEDRKHLIPSQDWTKKQYKNARKKVRTFWERAEIRNEAWTELKAFLEEKRNFLLRVLENPFLLEHESLSDVLRAVMHLSDELQARPSPQSLPDSDLAHLAGDIRRVRSCLVSEWIQHMGYLHTQYPYLFSLSVRSNPFDPEASPVIGGEKKE